MSYLESKRIRKEKRIEKIQLLQWFELLKANKTVKNLDLIEDSVQKQLRHTKRLKEGSEKLSSRREKKQATVPS